MAKVITLAGFTPVSLTTEISIPLVGFLDATVGTVLFEGGFRMGFDGRGGGSDDGGGNDGVVFVALLVMVTRPGSVCGDQS